MTSAPDLLQIRLCVDAEIARARLEEFVAECCDADVIWLQDVVHEALKQSAVAAQHGATRLRAAGGATDSQAEGS